MTTYTPALDDKLLARLQGAVRGEIIQPGDPDYDEARKVYNAMHDKRPAIIVRAVDVGDIVATVDFAREQNLLLAVRGGSHSVPGYGTCDGGVVLDLGRMRGIRVDPEASYGPGRGRLHLGGCQPRHACLRPGHHGRGRVQYRYRRADHRRRHGPSGPALRAGLRQPALGRPGHGRRILP